MYTIERNYCNCHPATCNCNPWIIKKDGDRFVTIYSKEDGELIVKAMNEMEKRTKKKVVFNKDEINTKTTTKTKIKTKKRFFRKEDGYVSK